MSLMPPLAAVAGSLAVAASPCVAAASTPEPVRHEGFETNLVHTGGGWDPLRVQAAVVLIGANNYG